MVSNPQNKMAGSGPGIRYTDDHRAVYVNPCACGGLVDVPASGEKVRCPCGVKHVWPPGDPAARRRPYGVRIVRVKNPERT